MRKLILLLLLFSSAKINAQSFVYCTDSTRTPDPYHACGPDYDPVCGCDQKTYRNSCAAVYWGDLFDNSYTTSTICGNFDFDIYPTALSVSNSVVNFRYFTKSTGTLTVLIFDAFGNKYFQKDYSITYVSGLPSDDDELNLNGLKTGVYMFIVTFNGEKLYRKIGMVKPFD